MREPTARICLWATLWGTLLAPALHLLNHRDDHVHLANGGLVHTQAAQAHRHGDGPAHVHQSSEQTPRDARQPGLHADPGTSPGHHGAGGALHFGLLLLEGATSPAPAPSPPVDCLDDERAEAAPPRSRPFGPHLPRGPPAAPIA